MHRFTVGAAFASRQSGPGGISEAAARRRLTEFGPNAVEEVTRESLLTEMLQDIGISMGLCGTDVLPAPALGAEPPNPQTMAGGLVVRGGVRAGNVRAGGAADVDGAGRAEKPGSPSGNHKLCKRLKPLMQMKPWPALPTR